MGMIVECANEDNNRQLTLEVLIQEFERSLLGALRRLGVEWRPSDGVSSEVGRMRSRRHCKEKAKRNS